MRMKERHECFKNKQSPYLYKIGMFAQMNHITIKTLHFYEEQGLLAPAYVDEANGYRYYTMDQMATIHQITALKQAGLTLKEIKNINSGKDANLVLQKKKSELLKQIAELTKEIAAIDGYILGDMASIHAPVLVKKLPAVTVAYVKRRINSYDELFEAMPEMGAKMEKLGLKCALPEYCYTEYLDDCFKEEDLLIKTCEAVTEEFEPFENLMCEKVDECLAACIYHKGSYDSFPKTYATALKFVEENGYEIVGSIRENYIDGIWNKDKEEDWLSEIQIPIRKCEE